jgi:hypothetical protein
MFFRYVYEIQIYWVVISRSSVDDRDVLPVDVLSSLKVNEQVE